MSEENTLASEENATPPVETVETPDSGEQVTETPQKRPSRARDRIQELNSDKKAAMEIAEFHRKQADELRAQLAAQTKPDELAAPDISTYDDAGKWAKDYATYVESRAEQLVDKKVTTVLETRDTQRSQQQVDNAFNQSLESAAEKYEDFWEVVYDQNATFMNGTLLNTVRELPAAGDLVYYLNTHPDEARQIAGLNPAPMAAALGRLETKLTEVPETPKPNLTDAPDPPTPIAGTPTGEVDLNKVSTQDYMRIRREQLKAKRGY